MATNGQTYAGTQLHLTATAPATHDDTGFAALTWTTKIGEIKNYGGGKGKTYTPVTYIIIEDREEKAVKGSYTNGGETLTLNELDTDAGQALLLTALDSDDNYYFRETLQSGAVFYYAAKVLSYTGPGGDANSIRDASVELRVDGDIIRVTAP